MDQACGHFAAILDAVAKPSFQFKRLFSNNKNSSAVVQPVVPTITSLEGPECYESLTVSTNSSKATHLGTSSGGLWESNGPSGTHWIQLNFASDFYVTELAIKCKARDSYRVAKVVLKGGSDESDLSTIATVGCDSVRQDDMLPMMADSEESYNVIRMCISADGINCRIDQIVVWFVTRAFYIPLHTCV